MSQTTGTSTEPTVPEYSVQYLTELQMWAVIEDGQPLAYCPERGSALFLAHAADHLRRALVGLRTVFVMWPWSSGVELNRN